MKIPDNVEEVCYDVWTNTARRLSMVHGVHISVGLRYKAYPSLSEVYFAIGDNEFGSLKELRRALKMKALL